MLQNKRFDKILVQSELLDIFLVVVGLVIPSIFGDIFESVISLIIELVVFFMFKKRYGNISYAILIIESFDWFDVFMGGNFDVIGWIEIIPFWFLLYKHKTNDAKRKYADTSKYVPMISKEVVIPEDSIDMSIFTINNNPENDKNLCDYCGGDISDSEYNCPYCGTLF